MLKLVNLKRCVLASLVAGLALGAQSATADTLWYYEGHGWLAQPPFSAEGRQGVMIAGGKNSPFPEYAGEDELPPFEVPASGRPVTVFVSDSSAFIAGPSSAAVGTLTGETAMLKSLGSPRIAVPAPYDKSGFVWE